MYRKVDDHGLRAAVYFTEHGGRLHFGSDTPSGPVFTNPPGYNGFDTIETVFVDGLPIARDDLRCRN